MTSIRLTAQQAMAIAEQIRETIEDDGQQVWLFSYDEHVRMEVEDESVVPQFVANIAEDGEVSRISEDNT
jgi:hypothetical protein